MIGPVVCLSCNRRLTRTAELISIDVANHGDWGKALDRHAPSPVEAMCCRRMLLTCKPYLHLFHLHDDRNLELQNIECQRHSTKPRVLQCI